MEAFFENANKYTGCRENFTLREEEEEVKMIIKL